MFLLASFIASNVFSQVTKAEYFIDIDPGYGSATSLAVASGNDITKSFTLPLSTVSTGFHTAGVRTRDAQGHWSQTYLHNFYVVAAAATTVSATEYFVDVDPGYGKATAVPVPVGADSSFLYVVPLSTYTNGFHKIGVRSKDASGRWSQTYQHVFYVDGSKVPANIVKLEYYFTGDGSNQQVYTYPIATPAPSVDLNFTANLSDLVGDREYDMHIWAVNSEGTRSEVLIKKMKACSGEVAKARFEPVQAGNQVSFINNSSGADKYQWNFGDSKIDSVADPLHNYTNVGIYTVQLIASNVCNSDTIKKVVSVVGLKDIFTNHGGQGGSVTVNVTGAGFVPGTKLYLHKNGQPDIYGDTLFILDLGTMKTTLNLMSKAPGLYDVIAIFPNNKKDTLHSAFTIESTMDTDLSVAISGPGVLRIGFNQVYTISMTNKSNTDAEFVPLGIGGLPLGTDIEILDPLVNVDSLQPFKDLKYKLDTVRRTMDDTVRKMSFRIVYINRIAAGNTQTLHVIFHVPETTQLHSFPRIVALLGESINIHTGITQRRTDEDSKTAGDCLSQLFIYAGNTALKEAKEFNDYAKCATGAISTFNTFLDFWVHAMNSQSALGLSAHATLDFTDFHKQLAETVISCLAAGETTVAAPEVLTAKLVKIAAGVAWDALVNYEDVFKCGEAFYNVAKNTIVPIIGNAWDPNQKYGPGDSSSNHYTTAKPLNYTINFENDPAANLNAQTVTVIDTLETNHYDKSSFGFTSVTVGDSIYSLPNPTKSFVHDFDLTPLHGVKARVTANFDTATGIAQWKFLTIDPVTNQATTDALKGFLPPDVASPKGQGYVSFVVNPNPNIKNGNSIKNKAYIKFDYNPVIVTNSWPNVFDLINPVSKVQPVPSEVYDTTFTVQWSGTDNASGIRSYDIYYKVGKGEYQLWQSDVSLAEGSFTGQKDSTYSFFSIAKDNAGNTENLKTNAERVVTIKIFDSSNQICPGANTTFSATPAGAGFTYQWQVNEGSSFVNVANNAVYTGANTSQLILKAPPTSYSNNKYRCKISNGTLTYYSSLHAVKFVATWLGTAGDAWETAANWSCGVVPDENTDVVITAGPPVKPVLHETTSCKSLTMNQAANLIIKSGAKLTITGKL